jgi:Rieske Fe-S protein
VVKRFASIDWSNTICAVNNRLVLLRLTKYLLGLLATALLYVLVDFMVDIRPSTIHASYRFTLSQLPLDQPVWLSQDNLTILLIHRSRAVIETIQNRKKGLQDANSSSSRQPSYTRNTLRSRDERYFVAYGLGTDLGCRLITDTDQTLRESCSMARYDFAGRAITGNSRFLNLRIPDYTFDQTFSVLTVYP